MVGLMSDVGNARQINEDYASYREDESRRLYVIADGMGGHNAGEVASKIAVETVIEYLWESDMEEPVEDYLTKAVEAANEKIYSLANKDDGLNGMGTTVTACLIIMNKLYIAHVGDSCCFLVCGNEIKKVTKDHSMVQQLLDNGSITEEEAIHHPNKNIITRALGTKATVEVDILKENMKGIKIIILCTDGLSNVLTPEEMKEIVMKYDPLLASKELVQCSKSKGGRDNISVIVIEGECEDGWKAAR